MSVRHGVRYRCLFALALGAALCACGEAPSTIVFQIVGTPAIRDFTSLRVEATIDGVVASKTFAATTLPQTFSLSSAVVGATSDVRVVALADAVPIGEGRGHGVLAATGNQIVLHPRDFVVPANFGGAQEVLPFYQGFNTGQQLAVFANGDFEVGYVGNCEQGPCDIMSRRFDAQGRPRIVGPGDAERVIASQVKVTEFAMHANGSALTVIWEQRTAEENSWDEEVMCTSISAEGTAAPPTKIIRLASTEDLHSHRRADGSMAVTWLVLNQGNSIWYTLVDPQCRMLVAPREVVKATSPDGRERGLNRMSLTSVGDALLLMFLDIQNPEGEVRLQRLAASGDLLGPEIIVPPHRQYYVYYGRVFADQDGVVLLANAVQPNSRNWTLVLWRLGGDLQPIQAPVVIEERGEFGYGVPTMSARESNEPLAVAWSACATDGFGCDSDVYVQRVWPSGLLLGERLRLADHVYGRQRDVSLRRLPATMPGYITYAAAYTDESREPPDASQAVRARVLYLEPRLRNGEIGADCGPAFEACGRGLACVPDADKTPRCTHACDLNAPGPYCPLGGQCVAHEGVTGCAFGTP